jgi:PIF1-like helicase
VGEKFNGIKLVVIDEISMINLESLQEMSNRHTLALLTTTTCSVERSNIASKPFGGIHVLFTGDFWQLKAIGGTPFYRSIVTYDSAMKGQAIWHALNEYSELLENFRFRNDTTTTLKDFLRGARVGKVDEDPLLIMNTRLMQTATIAKKKCNPAHKKEEVANLNEQDFKDKIESGAATFRIVAQHTPAGDQLPQPTSEQLQVLCSTTHAQGEPTYIDLAIGTRVSCTRNLGTQIGNITVQSNP